MNHLTAAEALTRVVATAAHGGDDDDGYTISDDDYLAVRDVARWLLAGAIARRQTTGDRLPRCTLKDLEMAAIKQALEDAGGNRAQACAALGINNSTLYRITNGISQSKWGRPKGAYNQIPAPTSLAADEC